MKTWYVKCARALRRVLRATGLIVLLDGWAGVSRTGLWVRSWLAIFDLDDLVRLDLPWWTFGAADEVAQHLERVANPRVFEWGSGASTLWLTRRAAEVVSIEHDAAWAEKVRRLSPSAGVELHVTPAERARMPRMSSNKKGFEGLDFSRYVAAIDDHPGVFDLIVIDGRAREACLARAVGRVAADGLIVFDNVDRFRYLSAIRQFPDFELEIKRGRTPALPYPTRTALLRRTSP